MKAFLLAAGRGTRLYPLTKEKPKALVEINGIPLLEIIIKRLMYFGIDDIIINVHHFGNQIIRFLEEKKQFGVKISISDETDQLMDTGGAITKIKEQLCGEQNFLIHNIDILSNLDLKALMDYHTNNEHLVSLAVKKRSSTRHFIFDEQLNLIGWQYPEKKLLKQSRFLPKIHHALAFSGVHVLNTKILEWMPESTPFSIVDFYLEIAREHDLKAFRHDDDFWFEVGRFHNISMAEKQFKFGDEIDGFMRLNT